MQKFMEEYGLVIVAVVVVAALLGLALFFKNTATTDTKNQIDGFMSNANSAVSEAGSVGKDNGATSKH